MEKDLIEWIMKISEPRKELGGFSICPFAKKSLEDKKIFWGYIGYEPERYILRYLETAPSFEVVVFYNLKKNLTDQDLIDAINILQAKMPELVFLKDHPDNPGFINGVNTSNEKYPIILVQPKVKLEHFREKLKKTTYYDYWSEDYKNEIWNYSKK